MLSLSVPLFFLSFLFSLFADEEEEKKGGKGRDTNTQRRDTRFGGTEGWVKGEGRRDDGGEVAGKKRERAQPGRKRERERERELQKKKEEKKKKKKERKRNAVSSSFRGISV